MTDPKDIPLDEAALALAKIRNAGETGDFKMAMKTRLDSMPEEHARLVKAVGEVRKIEVWFSDMSGIGDVFDDRDDPRIELLAKELGVPVSASDSVVEVCLRLRAQRPASD